MLVAGATDFARADPDYDGGLTGCHKVAVAAEGLGMDVEIHSCGPVMRHLMTACRNSNFYEVNLVHPDCSNAWSLPFYASDYSDQLDCVDPGHQIDAPSRCQPCIEHRSRQLLPAACKLLGAVVNGERCLR